MQWVTQDRTIQLLLQWPGYTLTFLIPGYIHHEGSEGGGIRLYACNNIVQCLTHLDKDAYEAWYTQIHKATLHHHSRTFHWNQTHCHTLSETQQVSQLDSVFINIPSKCRSPVYLPPAGTSDDQTIMTTAGQWPFKFTTLTIKNINVRQFSSWACCWIVLTFLPFMKPLILSWRLLSLLLLL